MHELPNTPSTHSLPASSTVTVAQSRRLATIILACGLSLLPVTVWSAPVNDVAGTKHNLSATGPGPVKAVSETEICVFCHTPHGASSEPNTPLWNRSFSTQSYDKYTSPSIQATELQESASWSVDNTSKLCLSCHDGSLAIGQVTNAPGSGWEGSGNPIPMSGTGTGGVMAPGEGVKTGFTRQLGGELNRDLTNDHPISFTYDSQLALDDGELRDPAVEPHIGVRGSGVKPDVPLDPGGIMTCASCHDPHIRDADLAKNIKFLRLNRFQETPPAGGSFSASADIVCLACHDKLGLDWSRSAHADSVVADEQYKSGSGSPAELRDFPSGLQVWQAACLNCHDTHTVQGARRLLREGTDSTASPKAGGGSAIEETCYQCHTAAATSVLQSVTQVPDIETDFTTPGNRHMPIETTDQLATTEVHDILDADMVEDQATLGKFGNLINRHAECTDCHNPHRVIKNRLFDGSGSTVAATHEHASGHTNLASGALKGAWGVEPTYGSTSFQDLQITYTVKQGVGTSTDVNAPHVTREYQVCLKCHSDYGYDDDNVYPTGNRPTLRSIGGGTPPGTNNMDQYTNQAKEFQAPVSHRGDNIDMGNDGGASFNVDNHRSWHPVIGPTGRTNNSGAWLAPWSAGRGTQTMYCTDCHGNSTTAASQSVVPTGGENGNPWGPHGSSNNFILKGTWNNESGQHSPTGGSAENNTLCYKCHNWGDYGGCSDGSCGSGFMHGTHVNRIGRLECSWCHVMVVHGWKNKAFLVNLKDIGPEAGRAIGSNQSDTAAGYTQGPYYDQARLALVRFKNSGTWTANDCGRSGGDVGKTWMTDSGCSSPP